MWIMLRSYSNGTASCIIIELIVVVYHIPKIVQLVIMSYSEKFDSYIVYIPKACEINMSLSKVLALKKICIFAR